MMLYSLKNFEMNERNIYDSVIGFYLHIYVCRFLGFYDCHNW